MLRNCLVGKAILGVIESLVASSSTPAPKGASFASDSASGVRVGRNRLHAFATQ